MSIFLVGEIQCQAISLLLRCNAVRLLDIGPCPWIVYGLVGNTFTGLASRVLVIRYDFL